MSIRFIKGLDAPNMQWGCEIYRRGRYHRAAGETRERALRIALSMAGIR